MHLGVFFPCGCAEQLVCPPVWIVMSIETPLYSIALSHQQQYMLSVINAGLPKFLVRDDVFYLTIVISPVFSYFFWFFDSFSLDTTCVAWEGQRVLPAPLREGRVGELPATTLAVWYQGLDLAQEHLRSDVFPDTTGTGDWTWDPDIWGPRC